MESSVIMGEADEKVCKENAGDDACVNGKISCDEDDIMEVDSDISKAPVKNVEPIENHKVPEKEVPTEQTKNGADSMDVDQEDNETEDQDEDEPKEKPEKNQSKENKKNGKTLTNGTDSSLNDSDVNMETSNLDSSVEIIENKKDKKSVDINDSSDVVVIEPDSEHKENGEQCNSPDIEEVISISDKDNESTSTVTPQKKKVRKSSELSAPPRRSSRNLNKKNIYIEKEDDPDIEEVTPEDPLADPLRDDTSTTTIKETPSKKTKHTTQQSSSTIVVSDTKRLVEIAANSKASNSSGKKEPTLVIIDTNSILSGRGPVPVAPKPATISTSFSMMPVALPAQGVYPPNMRATITPIPMSQPKPVIHTPPPAPVPPPPQILPTLTDDMFVVEAPSFIVPYVYEKPAIKPFKDFVAQMAKEIEEYRKKEEKLIEEKEKAEKEKIAEEKRKSDEKETEEQTKKDKKKEDDSESEHEEDEKDKDAKNKEKDKETLDKEKDKDGTDKEKDKEATDKEKDSKNDKGDKVESKADDKDKDAKVKEKEEVKETKKDGDTAKPKDSANDSVKTIDLDDIPDDPSKPKSNSYFDGPLGNFFINIGFGLVQEFVQTDLLKQQKRKNNREGNTSIDTKMAINSLIKNLEYSKENNEPYKLEQRKCEFCSFKTESNLVLAHHLETPHMRNYVYKCNFCPLEVRSPHDILFHMEAEHNIRGRLERAPAFHQCPSCPFEDNQKGKLSRHLINCLKKFKPEKNLEPPQDWEPPAKIPRVPKVRQTGIAATAATYQALAQQQKNNSYQLYKKLQNQAAAFPRRGRPSLMGSVNPIRPQPPIIRTSMMYRPGTSGTSVLVPTTYQFAGNQVFQNASAKSSSGKGVQQPSISITPLPRQPAGTTITKTSSPANTQSSDASSKATFVICEICDGYIKDLEQLRNHMQWIHKVKIHPKMIYNRPPLNCQKCQFRFFTDQGLERHLLGSHGLVTSSMQEAANKSKDAGRCPVCGRVYQWKLLNHVARDHNMTLKPAHLSYKCTVCTATFGMYKQFENHVYSAHSVVAKRVMEKKASSPTSRTTNDSLLKPLKINDEITIIPQPAKAKSNSATVTRTSASSSSNDRGK